jgi:hypothetical protein
MQTIQAAVNPRLLTKANRLFTGTLTGRIIEILQNARRAGATKVVIQNNDGRVTVRDNGQGIEDFSRLLDLGGSGWEELEASEDPAGVGIFCLAPTDVTIRSRGWRAVIRDQGWTGESVSVEADTNPQHGTVLEFADEPWCCAEVEPQAVFCGMEVIVDGVACEQARFVSDSAARHTELGCRIEVRESGNLHPWHRSRDSFGYRRHNVLVNFHGQVVGFTYHPISEHSLHYLVDLTGEPTGIRLMLPARTQLVENGALHRLQQLLELEGLPLPATPRRTQAAIQGVPPGQGTQH